MSTTLDVAERIRQLTTQGRHAEARALSVAAKQLREAYGDSSSSKAAPPVRLVAPPPPTPQAAPTTAAQPTTRRRPEMPAASELTATDLERVTRAAGIKLPMPTTAYSQHVEDVKRSRRLADRFVKRMARYEESDREQRAATIASTRIDGSNATGAQVAARLRELGINDAALETSFNPQATARLPAGEVADPHGRPPLPKISEPDEARMRADITRDVDHQIVRRVRLAIQRGEQFDARALTEAQMQKLLEFGIAL